MTGDPVAHLIDVVTAFQRAHPPAQIPVQIQMQRRTFERLRSLPGVIDAHVTNGVPVLLNPVIADDMLAIIYADGHVELIRLARTVS